MGDMRPKLKEIVLPVDMVKELADLIPKPENHFHYRIAGEWQPNREVYRVAEGDKVISDYSFPEKADMSVVQFASRKTYTKELNMWGKMQDYPVSFDRKTGSWKKLNVFARIKQTFSKETNIPAQVVTESVNGKDVAVLHTLEQKRPVGKCVQEIQLGTLQDAKVDLGLKYKHVDHTLTQLKDSNQTLKTEATAATATAAALQRQLFMANRKVADLTTQLAQKHAEAAYAKAEAQPHYTGPIHTKPKPEDVVEGKIVG